MKMLKFLKRAFRDDTTKNRRETRLQILHKLEQNELRNVKNEIRAESQVSASELPRRSNGFGQTVRRMMAMKWVQKGEVWNEKRKRFERMKP